MDKKKIVFCACCLYDGELRRFKRSFELVQILKTDFECVFTLNAFAFQQAETLKEHGISSVILNESDQGFCKFLSLLKGNEIVVIDDSNFTGDEQKQVKAKGCSLVCINDNPNSHFFADAVINPNKGFSKLDYSAEPYTHIYTLSENESVINNKSGAKAFVHGHINKIFSRLLKAHDTRLRRATIEDMMTVFGWINETEVRRQSFQQKFVLQQEHRQWFVNAINDPDILYYIYEVEGNPAGQIRFHLPGNDLTIHYLLAPEWRGKGLNAVIMKKGIEQVLKDVSVEIFSLHGNIKTSNIKSCEAFRNLAFRRRASTQFVDSYEYYYYFSQQIYSSKQQPAAIA